MISHSIEIILLLFKQLHFLTNDMTHKDQAGFDFWISIKQNIRNHERKERITKLKFEMCQLKIDRNLFFNVEHSFLPYIKELVFDNTGEITFMEQGLYTVGNTTVIFQNENNFRLNYAKNLFNANVSRLILQNLKINDFSSELFRGLSETSRVYISNCHLIRSTDNFQSKEVKISILAIDNVTLDHSNSVKPFLRLSGLKEARLTNIDWNFEKLFKNRGMIFGKTSKVLFENCTLSRFRAISGEVEDVSFKR